MLRTFLRDCKFMIDNIERIFFFGKYPPGLNFAENIPSPSNFSNTPGKFSIQEFMKEGILWAVPKHRRTLERRWKRKYGNIDRVIKTHLTQKDMLVCIHCGHDYKRGYLCKNCYTNVMQETKRLNKQIMEELKLSPIDQEIVILYKGEKENQSPEFWEGKRIIEVPEERPAFFSRNLMQKTTTSTSDCEDVKPEHLG